MAAQTSDTWSGMDSEARLSRLRRWRQTWQAERRWTSVADDLLELMDQVMAAMVAV